MATAAVRHAYEGLVSSYPEFGETQPTLDPRFPSGDGTPDREAMIAHVAKAIDARIAPRTDVVACPNRECRIEGGGVVLSISDVSMEGDDRGRVTLRFRYEDEHAMSGVHYMVREHLLEFRDDRWEVAGIGMRGGS